MDELNTLLRCDITLDGCIERARSYKKILRMVDLAKADTMQVGLNGTVFEVPIEHIKLAFLRSRVIEQMNINYLKSREKACDHCGHASPDDCPNCENVRCQE